MSRDEIHLSKNSNNFTIIAGITGFVLIALIMNELRDKKKHEITVDPKFY